MIVYNEKQMTGKCLLLEVSLGFVGTRHIWRKPVSGRWTGCTSSIPLLDLISMYNLAGGGVDFSSDALAEAVTL